MAKNKFQKMPSRKAAYSSANNIGYGSTQPYGSSTKNVRARRYPTKSRDATYVTLTEEIFRLSGEEDDSMYDEHKSSHEFDVDGEYLVNEEPYQLSLELETVDELRKQLHNTINRYERGYEKLCAFATRWHFLMEDVERLPQIEDMFNQMQMVRKLMNGQVF